MKAQPSSLLQKAILLGCGAMIWLQLSAPGAILTNRYSFNAADGTTVATDSVGGRDGTLINTSISGNQANLNNLFGTTSTDPSGKYVDLPDGIVSNLTAITIEAWLTPNHDDSTGGAEWNRIFDFGNANAAPFMWARSGDSSGGIRCDVVPVAGGNVVSGPPMPNLTEGHVVFTCNGATLRGRLYLNGLLGGAAAANDAFVGTPASLGNTTNNFLGRSQFPLDTLLIGTINEFRIWNGDLNPLEVAASQQAGPDTVSTSSGTVTSIVLQVSSPLAVNAGTRAVVRVQTDVLTNAVDIADSVLAVTYVLGNSNVLSVSTNGDIQAKAVGISTVRATYEGLSSTQSVTVIAVPTTMKNRYSFTADATDSVGGKDGTLIGNAVIAGGQVLLDGVTANSSYVDLPGGLIDPTNIQNSAVTVEGWATFPPAAAYPVGGGSTWLRLFDFGTVSAGLGAKYLFFSPNANGVARAAVSDADPGFGNENGFNTTPLFGRTNVHFVVVYNPNPGRAIIGLYLDGNFVGTAATTIPLTSVKNVSSYIGRSLYSGDNWLFGSIDEFRIYDGELDRFQIAASFQSGTATPNFNVGAFTSFSFDLGGATIPIDESRLSRAIMNFTAATNVLVNGDANLTLASSDTNIATITSPAGVIRSRGYGTATITAVYRYVTVTSTNSYTNSQNLTVVAPAPATLVHRYSFSETSGTTVADSVGTANGTITAVTGGSENFAWSGTGQLAINTNAGTVDTYVDLPDGIISVLSNATFEIWVNDNGSGTWAQFWDFGSAGGQPNIFLNRQSAGQVNRPRFDWSSGNISTPTAFAVPNGVLTHYVVVFDDTDNSASLYINGVLVDSSAAMGLSLSSINDTNNWLGRSLFPDPYVNGAYDEFRIWSGLFTAAQAQANFVAGTAAFGVARPTVTAVLSGNNIVASWTTNGTGSFVLESSGTVGPSASWANVAGSRTVVGLNYQQTVPLSSTNGFLRLKQ